SCFWIFYSRMINADEHFLEDTADGSDIPESNIAVYQLVLVYFVIDDPVHEAFDTIHIGFLETPGGGFNRVGQHEHSLFLREGDWARIAEYLLVHDTVGEVLQEGLVEVVDPGGPVVSLDKVDDIFGDTFLPGHSH